MFTEIQQYIKDKEYNREYGFFACLEINADFKENLPEAYREIFGEVHGALVCGGSDSIVSDRSLERYTRAEMLLISTVEDAFDDLHSTLANLITHHTNDYIKTVTVEIEDIEDEAIEVSLTAMRDKQQDIDCDNAERARSI